MAAKINFQDQPSYHLFEQRSELAKLAGEVSRDRDAINGTLDMLATVCLNELHDVEEGPDDKAQQTVILDRYNPNIRHFQAQRTLHDTLLSVLHDAILDLDAEKRAAIDLENQQAREARQGGSRTMRANPLYQDLPQVLAVTDRLDAGEFGAASCPHCGADGRYTYCMLTTQGERGAMAGCFSKFPRHKWANLTQKIVDKRDDNERAKTGRKLASWDAAILAAVTDFAHGKMTEADAEQIVNREQARKSVWLKSRGYGRR